jgi:beta-xylosidase
MIRLRRRATSPLLLLLLPLLLLGAAGSVPALARDPNLPASPTTVPAEPPIARTQAGTYTNPLGVDLADPDVLLHDGVYYLYATSLTNLGYLVWTSTDLVNWQQQEEMALSRDHLTWGSQNFWAPDAIHYKGKFYLFYSCVGPVSNGRTSHRICVAIADNPLGPFKETKAPMFEIGQAVIDAHVFVDDADGGKPYLYYSLDHSENWKRGGRRRSELYVVPLTADLLAIQGEPTFCFGATQPWEGRAAIEDTWNEAPFVFRHENGTYVMMYSARVFSDPLYAVGYATSNSPLGPWAKAEENPILKRSRRVSGPGHNSVVPSPDGKELFVVYHSHRELEGGYERELNIDRMTVTSGLDGAVKLRILGPTRTPQKFPSGAPIPSPTTRPFAAGVER